VRVQDSLVLPICTLLVDLCAKRVSSTFEHAEKRASAPVLPVDTRDILADPTPSSLGVLRRDLLGRLALHEVLPKLEDAALVEVLDLREREEPEAVSPAVLACTSRGSGVS